MNYHGRIAVGHFARKLAESDSSRNQYQVIAVLQALWLAAADPYADSPFVRVSVASLAGIVPTSARLSQIAAKLKSIGAVERTEFGFKLFKPAIDKLDAVAEQEVRSAIAVLGSVRERAESQSTTKTSIERTQSERDNERAAGRAALERLGKQPSDVRDVLATMAGMRSNNLRYVGRGSGAVQQAVTWLAETGTSWSGFVQLCTFVAHDPEKPADVVWLFSSRHDTYRERALTLLRVECEINKTAKEQQPQPSTECEVNEEPKPKRLGELDRVVVERWFANQVKSVAGAGHDDAVHEVWASAAPVAVLLELTGAEATNRIRAWQSNPERSLVSYFA